MTDKAPSKPPNDPRPKDDTRSEKQRMLAGDLYYPVTPELVQETDRAHKLVKQLNQTMPIGNQQKEIMDQLFGYIGENSRVETGFHCDYGKNIYIGRNVYINIYCIMLDCNKIEIGDNCQIAPSVHFYAATHPLDPKLRSCLLEQAHPIKVGNNVWIGGSVVVCPNVEIGDDSVIGTGSIVTRSIPKGVLAFGNPCRVIRSLYTDQEKS